MYNLSITKGSLRSFVGRDAKSYASTLVRSFVGRDAKRKDVRSCDRIIKIFTTIRMKKAERVKIIDQVLGSLYPNPKPPLNFETHYQLLVAVVLSAQCTDERVNIVTEKLFADRPGPNAILDLGEDGLKEYIKTCGLFNTKAKNIIKMTGDLLEKYKGQVPDDFDALVKLAGVGEKTAGVMMAQAFGKPAFPVDTHIHRLAKRLGLSAKKGPSQVSMDLKRLFPEDRWADLHLQIIFHGRRVCMARKPNCVACPLLELCPEGKRRMGRELKE